jgi:hypothetical protein
MRLASFLLIFGVLCARGFIHSALAPAHGSLPRPRSRRLRLAATSTRALFIHLAISAQALANPCSRSRPAAEHPRPRALVARMQTLVFPFPGVVKLCWPFPASARAKANSLWKLEQNTRGGAGQDGFITMQHVARRRMHTRAQGAASSTGFMAGKNKTSCDSREPS